MRCTQALSVPSVPFLLAAISSASVLPRQSDPSNQSIGGLRANGGSYSNYVVSATFYDPTNIYNGPAIISLNPPALGDPQSFTYSVESGKIHAKSPNGEVSWQVPTTTGPVTMVGLDNGSTGFTFEDGRLLYKGTATSWYGCTSKQTNGALVLYFEVGSTVPSDGECSKVQIVGA